MNEGIVLKINNSSVIVLTADGRYLKCKRQLSSYTIGQEIQFPNQAIIVNKKINSYLPKLVPVMIASVLIFMSFLLVDWNKKRVLAAGYITVDSKAKISLIIDKQLNVIEIKALNGQGKKIVNKMDDWKQESLHLVMDDLMIELKKNEVVQPNEKINLSGTMEKKYKNEQRKLNKKLEDIQKKNPMIKLKKSDKKVQSEQNKPRKMDEYNKNNKNKKETDDFIKSKNEHIDKHQHKNKSKSSLNSQHEEYKQTELVFKETNSNDKKTDKENRKTQTNNNSHLKNSNENHYPKHNKSSDNRKDDDKRHEENEKKSKNKNKNKNHKKD